MNKIITLPAPPRRAWMERRAVYKGTIMSPASPPRRSLVVVAHLAAEFCPVQVLQDPLRVLGPQRRGHLLGAPVRRLGLDHVERVDDLVAGRLVLAAREEALEERGLRVVDHRG